MNNIFSKNYLPETNFYLWVNENWKDNNKIPNIYQRWGSFNILCQENKMKIKDILENLPASDRCKILYEQGLTKSNSNLNELFLYLNDIDKCLNMEALLNLIVDYQMLFNMNSPFIIHVHNDLNNANINILHLFTGGLNLPDRDYYLLESKANERIEYKIFLKKYSDYFNINLDTDTIYKIEEELAKYTHTNIEQRNPELQNNPTYLDKLPFTFMPYLFKKINKTPGKINLTNPKFFAKLNSMFSEINISSWKDYFKMQLLLSAHAYISEEPEKIYFDFFSKFLASIPCMKPLWKRSLNIVNDKLGFLIGKYFVEKHFDKKSKIIILKLVEYIKIVLQDRINNLEWLSSTTKKKALEKLNLINQKIGYPDKWREYKSDIKNENSYLKNNILCNLDDAIYTFSKLYNNVDKTVWEMNPQEVNAYYSPSNNEIVFPAGILQPPFFSSSYDPGLNFGGIGTIIGHEITHAFDDEGSKYDGHGNLNNWWLNKDFQNYKKTTDKLIDQCNKFEFSHGNIIGKLTLGENIADLGGITIALEALKKYLHDNSMNDNKFIQRFFINYAIVWRSNIRDKEIENRLITDVHSPPEFRVNGVLKNIDDFYLAFNIKKEHSLFLDKKDRIKIW